MEKKEMKGGVFNECLLTFFRQGVRTDRRGGAGEGEEGQPNADSCRQGEGVTKITKNVRTSFMDGPLQDIFETLLIHINYLHLNT